MERLAQNIVLPPGWRKSVPSDGAWARDREWIVCVYDPSQTRVAAIDGQWMAYCGYYFGSDIKAALAAALEKAIALEVKLRTMYRSHVDSKETRLRESLEALQAFDMPPIELEPLTAEQKREHRLMAEAEARAAERGCAS
jgi:predicted SPOUT superfamily RNA methylase MTH1